MTLQLDKFLKHISIGFKIVPILSVTKHVKNFSLGFYIYLERLYYTVTIFCLVLLFLFVFCLLFLLFSYCFCRIFCYCLGFVFIAFIYQLMSSLSPFL